MDLWNNFLLADAGLMLVGIPLFFIWRAGKNKASNQDHTK